MAFNEPPRPNAYGQQQGQPQQYGQPQPYGQYGVPGFAPGQQPMPQHMPAPQQFPGQQQPPQQPMPMPSQPYPPQPPPGGQYAGAPRQRVNPGVLAGVSVWRAVIVGCALYGFSDATGWTENFEALSQLASLFAAVVYLVLLAYPLFTGGTRHEPRSPWLRGAVAVVLLLVSSAFFTLMGGDVDYLPFEHIVTPVLVLLDWLFVGRDQAATRWWFPLTWVVPPLAYLVYFLAAGIYEYLYPFLDPDDEGFAGMVAGLLGGVVVIGYVLYGIGKLKAGLSSAARQHPPVTQRVH